MANIRDVARTAGVSAGTVSNVLNRPSYVSTEIRERVQRAIDELGFVPTAYARQYRAGRQRVLGFAIVDLANPFFVDVALGAEAEAKRHGVGIVLSDNGEDPEREQQNLDLLVQLRVHGMIVSPVHEETPRLDALRARGIPIVYLDRIVASAENSFVIVDHLAGGRLAGRHLAGLGHRRLGFVGDPGYSRLVSERLRGFREGAAEAGASADDIEILPAASWTSPAGAEAATALLRRDPRRRPTGVFCANDMLAKGVLQACRSAGVDVPGQLSLVGYDDLEWAADLAVPLTTVRQPRAGLGAAAVELLLELMDDPGTARHRVLDPELVVRESTRRVRTSRARP